MIYKIFKPFEKGVFTDLVQQEANGITQSRLKKLVRYIPTTGEFYWVEKPFAKARIKVGQLAGFLDSQRGYLCIKIDGKKYLAHRLAWLYSFGAFPIKDIDHIDGNRSNNRLDNLRDCTPAVNNKNQKKYSTNTSGITGVKLDVTTRKSGNTFEYWTAHWRDALGRGKQKSFSVTTYGFLPAKLLAIECRNQRISELIQHGAEYTPRHGT